MVHGLARGKTGSMMTWVVLVLRVICSNGSSEQESETIGFGQENRHILRSLFRFK